MKGTFAQKHEGRKREAEAVEEHSGQRDEQTPSTPGSVPRAFEAPQGR